MVKFPIVTVEWNICTPSVFRFLNQEYVDSFFKDGTLRLSSFVQFSKHKDEQRQDKNEGQVYFVEQTSIGTGETIENFSRYGYNAYILSSSMRYSKELADSFNCDSYIKIKDSTGFGITVAKQIPNVITAFEAPCEYRDMGILLNDTRQPPKGIDFFKNEKGLVDIDKIAETVAEQHPPHLPYYLKDSKFAHQSEYRFVWITSKPIEDTLFIKVPEAIQFCEKPNKLTE
jgi:hypothetical protein